MSLRRWFRRHRALARLSRSFAGYAVLPHAERAVSREAFVDELWGLVAAARREGATREQICDALSVAPSAQLGLWEVAP